ncbi:helix-turn-helix domain-containing protein [Prodigiosinella aquatilis]|nr:helix-turn-helix domain-containing protein [Prodigiosinella sp. LS101]WJV54642.1 helix-turn-helix domain-containing protein [Prodigiosinella sp. LS101]WJV59005.1 helix-turn-helix domain-containing protein [Pectobacteriaceae bacterium C111]
MMATNTQGVIIKPLQPWFVMNAAETYLKKSLSNSPIAHFYSFSIAKGQKATLVVPDGSIDILFNCSDLYPHGRVCGSTLAARPVELCPGERYFGVRFMPGVMPDFLDLSAIDLAGKEISFQDAIPGAYSLFERLVSSHDFDYQIALFCHHFGQHLSRSSSQLLLQLIDIIMAHNGVIRIEQLEQKTLYSARYIHRLFSSHCGMSTKAFCSTIRFQRALSLLNQGEKQNMAALAQQLGYADQSHFLREFKQFALCSPREYLSGIQATHYQSRICQH